LLPADAEPYTTHPVCGRVPGGFRNPLEQRHGRPAATGRAGPALWPVPVKLNGPSGRWRVRCAGSRNRGRAHGPYCHLPPARGGARSEGVRAYELCGMRLNCAQPMQSGPKPISAAVRPVELSCGKTRPAGRLSAEPNRKVFSLLAPARNRSISTTRFDPVQKLAKQGFGRPFIFGQCFCPSVDGPLRSPEISAVTRRQMVIAHEPDAIEVLVSDQPAVA